LLLVAALGAWVFAVSDDTAGLLLGRALIGFGVSACLMAPFKAYTTWFPRERLPQVNGFQMAAGGLGALTATAPVEMALQVTDWRGVFHGLSLLTLAVALLIWCVVPRRAGPPAGAGLGAAWRGVARVFTSRLFWRVAPWTMAAQASFLSIQGLWAGPWLRDVGGLERDAAAAVLAGISVAMVCGFVVLGTLAERAGRAGRRPLLVAELGLGVFMAVQLLLIAGWRELVWPLWLLFGFFGTVGILPYAVLSQRFPGELAGRVNTGMNLLVFGGAFAFQWGLGVVIGWWSDGLQQYAVAGYRVAFGLLLGLQVAAFGWYLLAGRDLERGAPLVEH
jgi:MFS family permease